MTKHVNGNGSDGDFPIITEKTRRRYAFLAPHAKAEMPRGKNEDAKAKLFWSKDTATRAYDANSDKARILFDVRSPRGCPKADTRKRGINIMTNFILNAGSEFYDWLGKFRDVNVGWTDHDGVCRGLRVINTKSEAEALEHWRQRHVEGVHAAADRIAERLQRLSEIEVKRTQLIAARIAR